MANDKIVLMAEANRLGVQGYRKMSDDELRTAIATAQGASAAPVKGKGKQAAATNGTKGKPAAEAVVKGKPKAKGKPAAKPAKPAAKQTPAKSTAKKTTPTKGKASQGTAKRSATGGKKPGGQARTKSTTGAAKKTTTKATTAKPRGKQAATSTVEKRREIDNKKINWRAESSVGLEGKRKEVLDSLRRHKGDKEKVWYDLEKRAKAFYPTKPKAEAERLLVWLIGRVAFDFVSKTGQHTSGKRAAYGTSKAPQDVQRRAAREEERLAREKAERAAKRSKGKPKSKR